MTADFNQIQVDSRTVGQPASPILGLHHVTTFASDPQANADFYTKILGLRLVKVTVNFDDPSTYHLYFGDSAGNPGTILTFFPIVHAARGKRGVGEVSETAFAVPRGSMSYWKSRLAELNVRTTEATRFGAAVLECIDGDGTSLALLETGASAPETEGAASDVPADRAITGFHGVTLRVSGNAETEKLLTGHFGFRRVAEEGARVRFASDADAGQPGRFMDLIRDGNEAERRGPIVGAGSVHHVAMRVRDDAAQQQLSRQLSDAGYRVTEQRERCYFRSVYFRETGGVLFELATDGPGFAIDEAPDSLGSSLKLPHWLERTRPEIERSLPVFSSGSFRSAAR